MLLDFSVEMRNYIEAEIKAMRALSLQDINSAINAILDARERSATIYIMGNGGSAATASHMAGDFAKGVSSSLGGKKFCFECLNDSIPILTAIANDICYEDVFVFQLKGQLKKEDLVIGISGSGNSENVVRAIQYAKQIGTPTIGITGYSGGKVKDLCDYSMHTDIDDMQIAEDMHMMFDHMIMRVLEKKLK